MRVAELGISHRHVALEGDRPDLGARAFDDGDGDVDEPIRIRDGLPVRSTLSVAFTCARVKPEVAIEVLDRARHPSPASSARTARLPSAASAAAAAASATTKLPVSADAAHEEIAARESMRKVMTNSPARSWRVYIAIASR